MNKIKLFIEDLIHVLHIFIRLQRFTNFIPDSVFDYLQNNKKGIEVKIVRDHVFVGSLSWCFSSFENCVKYIEFCYAWK